MTDWPESVLEYERLTVTDRTVEWNDKAEAAIRDLKKMVNALRNDLADLLPVVDAVGFYEENMDIALKRAEQSEKALECAVEEWQQGEIPPDDVHDFLTLHPELR